MQSLTEIFKNLFKSLSRSTQQIYKYLHWMCNKYHFVEPSIDRIAAKAGVSRRTVFNALKLFIENGWLATKRRAYRTNVYFMSDELLKLDPSDPKTFEKLSTKNEDFSSENCTICCTKACTVVRSKSDIKEINDQDDDASEEAKNIDRLKQAVVNKSLPLTPKHVDFFCLRYGFDAVKNVLKRIVKNSKLENKFKNTDNPPGYLTICLRNEVRS